MELLLALAVITAVIIFGALISLGNERQGRAIDHLREQVVLWAIQDLRIKREHLKQDVRVDDPLGWLNRIATKACGFDLKLRIVDVMEEPSALVCSIGDGDGSVIFTPLSPYEIRNFQQKKRGRLSQISTQSPLLHLPRKATGYDISALNGGVVFDLELPLVWNSLTGKSIFPMERIWMYTI